jgi:hypothetical protein
MPLDMDLRDSQRMKWRKRYFSAEAGLKFNGRRQVCRLCNVTAASPLDRTSERWLVGKYRPCDGVGGGGLHRGRCLYTTLICLSRILLLFFKILGMRTYITFYESTLRARNKNIFISLPVHRTVVMKITVYLYSWITILLAGSYGKHLTL